MKLGPRRCRLKTTATFRRGAGGGVIKRSLEPLQAGLTGAWGVPGPMDRYKFIMST